MRTFLALPLAVFGVLVPVAAQTYLGNRPNTLRLSGLEPAATTTEPSLATMRRSKSFGQLPLVFEVNRGQVDAAEVQYFARSGSYAVAVAGNEVLFSLNGDKPSLVRMTFPGSSREVRVVPEQPTGGVSNYLIGDESQWITGVPHYARLRVKGLWKNIDLVLYGNDGSVEYDFVAGPGADARKIAIEFSGADLNLEQDGSLALRTAAGTMFHSRPVSTQGDAEATTRGVRSSFQLAGTNRLQFALDGYDPARPITIDPRVTFVSYAYGIINGMALDSAGNPVLVGSTTTAIFTTTGAFRTTGPSGASDAFLFKLNATGTAYTYSTYFGGSDLDFAHAVAVDSAGNPYVVGSTASTTSFPRAPAPQQGNAYPRDSFGGQDGFIAKFNTSASGLVYSTPIGGSATDEFFAITVNSAGEAHLAGNSTSGDFPTTAGVVSTAFNGNADVVVVKVNATGTNPVFSTYYGGAGSDVGRGIALDSGGNIYVCGSTTPPSSGTDFPTSAGAYQAARQGQRDGFVLKLTPNGQTRVFSTFLGSTADDGGAFGIAVDQNFTPYVVGDADAANIIASPLRAYAGGKDAFVVRMNGTGTGLLFGLFLGGSGTDYARAMALDSNNTVHVVGGTNSPNYPQTVTPAATPTDFDAFLTQISKFGNFMWFSTLLGGNGFDEGRAVAANFDAGTLMAGQAASNNIPTTGGVIGPTSATGAGLLAAFTPGLPANNLFITQSYSDVLNRQPDPSGLASFNASLANGTYTRGDVIWVMLLSQEFQNRRLYDVVLSFIGAYNRDPDYATFNFYDNQLAAGNLTGDALFQSFLNSAEFTNLWGTLSNQQFVRRVYLNALGREPDPGGSAYFTGLLDTNQATRAAVFRSLATSQEAVLRSNSRVYANFEYMLLLRRTGDQLGLTTLINWIAQGISYPGIIDAVLYSPEYLSRY